MEILAVSTARLIALFPTDELNPRGRAIVPDITLALVERYGFIKAPTTFEDYDEQKGVSYAGGQWDGIAIDKLEIFRNGIVVNTRSSTEVCEAFLKDALIWGKETFSLAFRPEMLKHKAYLSELIVRTDTSLNALNPALRGLAARISESAGSLINQQLTFENIGIAFGFDPMTTKHPLTPLKIERLADTPFSENKYYSSAPIPTAEHILFLEEFEAALKG